MNNYIPFYALGEFAASTMLEGKIQPDFTIDNVGVPEDNLVFVDYADMLRPCNIPDDLNQNLIRQLTVSLLLLIRSVRNFHDINLLRAGFTARGGLFADMLWMNLANKRFTSLSNLEIYDKPLPNDAINKLLLTSNQKLISYWKTIPFDKINKEKLSTLDSYQKSETKRDVSPLSDFYLDRLYYSRCYNNLFVEPSESPESSIDTILLLSMNMGMSAFRHNRKYCAFDLLAQCRAMTPKDSYIHKISENALIKLTLTHSLLPGLKKIILDNIDCELFEFLWLLSDIDTFESQLSEL